MVELDLLEALDSQAQQEQLEPLGQRDFWDQRVPLVQVVPLVQ